MNIENISIRRKDYEMQLKDAIDNLNATVDKNVGKRYDLEINFIIDQIKLYKKWEKILDKYEEIKNDKRSIIK